MIIAGTGHRDIRHKETVESMVARTFDEARPDAYIQGMADGFDLISAMMAIKLNIPVISAIPWTTHYKSTKQPDIYRWVLNHSEEVFPVTEVDDYPGPWVFHKRNQWMIDEGDKIMAWWDGRESGGTWAAIKYARKQKKPVRNIYATN